MMGFHPLNLSKLLTPDGYRKVGPSSRLEVYRALRQDTEMIYLWLREAETTGQEFRYQIFSTYFADVIFCLNCLEQIERSKKL